MEFRKVKNWHTSGKYKFQGIVNELKIDGAILLEIVDVWFYYTVLEVEYCINFWKDMGDAMQLYRSMPSQIIA